MKDVKAMALYPVMLGKLNAWAISARARAIGAEIAALSLAEGRWEVEVQPHELGALTGMEASCVSKAIRELQEGGVLQGRGRQRSMIYRLMVNGEFIEPERIVNAEAARALRAAICARNAGRVVGDDAKRQGQLVQALPMEERLPMELAEGSNERAIEEIEQMGPDALRVAVMASLASTGNWSEADLAALARRGEEGVNNRGGAALASPESPPSLPVGKTEFACVANSLPVLHAGARARVESTDRQIVESIESSRSGAGAREGGSERRFRDDERNLLMAQVDEWLGAEAKANPCLDRQGSRRAWIARIRDFPSECRDAFAEVRHEMHLQRIFKPLGRAYAKIRRFTR